MKKLILWAFVFLGHSAFAAEVKVAAAADLKFAMDDIIAQYQKSHAGEKVTAIYGASGKFLSQIKEGAPFDLFFSADTEKAEGVASAGRAAGKTFPYAKGHLVVWTRNDSSVKLDSELQCLLDSKVQKIAVANPVTAPYGQIAEASLKKANLHDKVKRKLVTGENISQTAQFAESGAAQVGLIAKSLAQSATLKKEGHFVDVNPSFYPPLIQSGVVLKGANEIAANKFKEFFMSAEGKKILSSYGLDPSAE